MGGERGKGEGVKQELRERRGGARLLWAEPGAEGRAMGRHSRRGFMWEAGHWIPRDRRPNQCRRRVI